MKIIITLMDDKKIEVKQPQNLEITNVSIADSIEDNEGWHHTRNWHWLYEIKDVQIIIENSDRKKSLDYETAMMEDILNREKGAR